MEGPMLAVLGAYNVGAERWISSKEETRFFGVQQDIFGEISKTNMQRV
jgi:hypothetical protein